MQTDHPEPTADPSIVHFAHEEEAQPGLLDESTHGFSNARDQVQAGRKCLPMSGAISLQLSGSPSRVWLPEMAEPQCHALHSRGLGASIAETESSGVTHRMLLQSTIGLGKACKFGLQTGSDPDTHMVSDCQQSCEPAEQERLISEDGWEVDQEMVCSSSATAVEAAAAAATLPSLTVTSSPCSTFQLPTALSQGIAESPALSGGSSSDPSTRRKSFSPLESGPVSILPMVENPQIGLPSVTCSTLAQLIDRQPGSLFTDLKIVDCR